MANVKISQLTAGSALTGTEEIPLVQSGSTVRTTAQDIADLAGGPTLDVVTVGTLGTSSLTVSVTSSYILNPAQGSQSAPLSSVPNFTLNGGMGFSGTLSSISFPTLVAGTISISGVPTLTTIDLPALEVGVYLMMGSLSFSSNSSLTTLNIPSLTSIPVNSYFGWSGNAFSQQTVDNILVRMVATNATNATLDLSQGTSSAPSSVGLAAITTLQSRGWNVTTN